MICSVCGTESESKFCPDCGAPLEIHNYKTCKVCGTKGKYEFCKNCGNALEEGNYKTCKICGTKGKYEFCKNCGNALEEGNYKTCKICGTKGKYEFCKNCGNALAEGNYKTCKVCGTKGKYKFCKNCGTPFEIRFPLLESLKPTNKKLIAVISGVAGMAVLVVIALIVFTSQNKNILAQSKEPSKSKTVQSSSQALISSQTSQAASSSSAQASSSAATPESVGNQTPTPTPTPTQNTPAPAVAPAQTFEPDYSPGQENRMGNTSANITNGGIAATQGDWIYYAVSGGSVHGIYKIRKDGSGKKQIDTSYDSCINVIGDWIYYKDAMAGLCKIKTDGSAREVLCNDTAVNGIFVIGDTIYYSACRGNNASTDGAWRMQDDGSSKKQLVNCDLFQVNFSGDWIYYINQSSGNGWGIYKAKTDGSSIQLVSNNSDMQRPYIIDRCDYYTDHNTLGKIALSNFSDPLPLNPLDNVGVGLSSLNTDTPSSPNWIFYGIMTDNSGGGALYRISNNGDSTTKSTLLNQGAININIVGDWIYYRNTAHNQNFYKMRLDGTENQALS